MQKSLDLPEREETFVSGYVRRGNSFPVCPQRAEHCLRKLQRWVRAVAISLDARDRHEPLKLWTLPQRSLCESTGHSPHSLREPVQPTTAGSCDLGTTSLGEHMARFRLLQRQASLCHLRLTPHSNYDYRTAPPPRPELARES